MPERNGKIWCIWYLIFALLAVEMGGDAVSAEEKPLEFRNSAHRVGNFTLSASPVDFITDTAPHEITYTLENKSDQAIAADAVFSSIETIHPISDEGTPIESITKHLEMGAGESQSMTFRFSVEEGTLNALFPLRVTAAVFPANGADADSDQPAAELEAVRVIDVRLPNPVSNSFETITFAQGISLLDKSYRIWQNILGEEPQMLGSGFDGSDPDTHASFHPWENQYSIHPPFRPKGGSLWIEYPIQFPEAKKLTLSYAGKIRNISPKETPSDGVTFRVWGVENTDFALQDADLFAAKHLQDEFHTDSKTWEYRTIDLSEYAGKTASILVEINPGPANNTNCDGCFLSGLVLAADSAEPASPAVCEPVTLEMDDGFSAVLTPGKYGLFDAKIAVNAFDERTVEFDGISAAVGGCSPLDQFAVLAEPVSCRYDEKTKKIICQTALVIDDAVEPITIEAYIENGLLCFTVTHQNGKAPSSGFQLGAASEKIDRVYYGHGMVVEEPTGAFRIDGEGHRLSTRHVGFDYANGISICLASKTPPDALIVDPAQNIGTLSVVEDAVLAISPSVNGCFDAAVKFRKKSPWREKPAPGTARKAGRLAFDVWGGNFAENARTLEKLFAYGVTDALFVNHAWQRWGYDVRLPDIWGKTDADAVSSGCGSLADLQYLASTCTDNGVPFALHDNYIDFYPDADGFSYDDIAFTAKHQPVKAWINYGAQTQSYRFCPDRIFPYLERNMTLNQKYMPMMDAYFVDVLSSIHLFPYYDRSGNYHQQTETVAAWKKAFERISEQLAHEKEGKNEPAITISEAGNDFLVGSLSGADAQWIPISPTYRPGTYLVPCEEWERTPWFAAVNHTNYSRHGVGYESRYIGDRNPALHGIMSDDYLSMELLGGVDLMVDLSNLYPGAVRKHYLSQPIVRSRAEAEIESVTFETDESGKPDIKRQTVQWSDGTTVKANRGTSDWLLADGSILPQYGVLCTRADGLMTFIGRNPANLSEVIEYSRRPNGAFYLNGRGFTNREFYPVQPILAEYEVLNGGQFRIAVDWNTSTPLPKKLNTFVHVFEPYRGYGHTPKGWYAGGENPAVPTDEWGLNGQSVRTDETVFTIPDDIPEGNYHIMVGLYDRETGKRYPLMGNHAGENRYSVAELNISRNGDQTAVAINPLELDEPADLFQRLLANKTPAAFGGVETLGAVYAEPGPETWRILPLPLAETFTVTLDEQKIGREVKKITFGEEEIPFERDLEQVTFTVTVQEAQAYEVHFK